MKLYKAEPMLRDGEVPNLCVVAREVAPRDLVPEADPDYLRKWRQHYTRQARYLLGKLHKSLPGGTMDALFGLMAEERASIFRVPE